MRTLIMFALLASTACRSSTPEATTTPSTPEVSKAAAVPAKVLKAAAIAKAVNAKPESATATLASHKMSTGQLESLMYEIAEDPALSAAYQSARR